MNDLREPISNMNKKVTIIGGGHQGLAMAAHLTKYGVKCYLWNRTVENIKDIIKDKLPKANCLQRHI